MKNNGVLIIFVMFGFFFTATVGADEVRLKNGDRLTGEVKTLEEDKLIFETPYAGEITIAWSEVDTLTTDTPIKVVLIDESVVAGVSQPAKEKEMSLVTDKIDGSVSFSLADVKTINPKPQEPAVKLSGRANVGIDVKEGNTDTETYHFDGMFAARTEKNRYKLSFQTNNEKSAGMKTAKNWLGAINYDHFIGDKWFLYGNASFENDEFKDLNMRTVLGVGSGYQFMETPEAALSVEAGLSYVNVDYMVDEDESYPAGRFSIAFEKALIDNRLVFFHDDEALISLEDADDIVIRTKTGFRFPFYNSFNMTVQYNWDHDKTPATGQEKTDKSYLITLGYEY